MVNILNVNVCPNDRTEGYIAVCAEHTILYADGATIDEAVANFRKQYGEISKLMFKDGQIEFKFNLTMRV